MRIVLKLVGVLLLAAGGMWFLQGVGVVPGSFMTSQAKWAGYGVIAIFAGLAVMTFANRRRS